MYFLNRIVLFVLIFILMLSCYDPNRRKLRVINGITCVEPPPTVLKSSSAIKIDASMPSILEAIKASTTVETKFERIRSVTVGVTDFEVLEYRMCVAYANGAISSEQYNDFINKILPDLKEK